MTLELNPTPLQVVQAVRRLEQRPAAAPAFTKMELEPAPMWITYNTVMLENQPLEDGDTYLLTFYLYGDTHKSSNFSIIYTVNPVPEELDNTRSEATVHFFKGYSGEEYRLDLFVDFSLNALRASTDCDNLFLMRAGFLPSFGAVGNLYK